MKLEEAKRGFGDVGLCFGGEELIFGVFVDVKSGLGGVQLRLGRVELDFGARGGVDLCPSS